MGVLVQGIQPIRQIDLLLRWLKGVVICAFLSLGERLDTKPGFVQVRAFQSFRGCAFQVVSR